MYNLQNTAETPIRILLVDDDDDDVFLFSEALRSIPLPTEMIIAENGLVALKILQNTSNFLPDLIFLDLHMPVMKGIELLKILKTHDLYHPIPCIVLTGFESKSYIDEAYDLKANLFVIKPIDHNKLVKILEQVLGLNWNDYFPPKSEAFLFA